MLKLGPKKQLQRRDENSNVAGEVCLLLDDLREQGREPKSNEFYYFSAGINNQLNQLSNPPLGLIAVVGSTSLSCMGSSD